MKNFIEINLNKIVFPKITKKYINQSFEIRALLYKHKISPVIPGYYRIGIISMRELGLTGDVTFVLVQKAYVDKGYDYCLLEDMYTYANLAETGRNSFDKSIEVLVMTNSLFDNNRLRVAPKIVSDELGCLSELDIFPVDEEEIISRKTLFLAKERINPIKSYSE